MAFRRLFAPGKLGELELKNRVMMAPMVRNYAEADGKANARYVAHIERIARGGVGALILEASYVSPEGKGFMHELGLHDDSVVPALRKVTAVAHKHGAAIGIQLYHAGRQTSSKTTGLRPIAPSSLPDPTVNEVPDSMDQARIRAVVKAFGLGAVRAKAAGCDFVELHGAHGYLITQFLSSFSNRRTDQYGGSLENRMRFMLEVYEEVRARVGKDYPVSIRLSADEMVDGGLKISETVKIARVLEKAGIAAIHVSAGNYASYARGRMIPPMAVPDAPLVSLAAAVKKCVSIPVIAVAKIRDPKTAEAILRRGEADFIALGRPLLADPDWVEKAKKGKAGLINPCIACNQGCISRLFAQQDVWCTVNPENGRERAFAKPHGKSKKVFIVGGGPAGMSAAKTAAERGHKVTLFEKSARLGGQLFAAESAPHREGWRELRAALVRDVKRLGIKVLLKKEFGVTDAVKSKPDAVIIATGSTASVPKIPGIGRTNVVTSRDILEGRTKAKGDVVIVGGGCAGAQTAEHLASKGHKVTIVEASAGVAADAPVDDRNLLLGRLVKRGVRMLTDTSVMSISENAVQIEHAHGTGTIKARTVVLCLGSDPKDGLEKALRRSVRSVTVVGDAKEARRVTDAVAEGALAALAL